MSYAQKMCINLLIKCDYYVGNVLIKKTVKKSKKSVGKSLTYVS